MATSAVREVVQLMLKGSKIQETSKTLRGLEALALIEKRGKRKEIEKKVLGREWQNYWGKKFLEFKCFIYYVFKGESRILTRILVLLLLMR